MKPHKSLLLQVLGDSASCWRSPPLPARNLPLRRRRRLHGRARGTGGSRPYPRPGQLFVRPDFGEQLHCIGLGTSDVLADAISRGMKDGLQGKRSTQAERQQVQEYARSMMVAFAARNKTAAQEFLAHNGHEKGVKTTARACNTRCPRRATPRRRRSPPPTK